MKGIFTLKSGLFCLFLLATVGLSAQITLKGKVVDASNQEPLFSANVLVKGATNGVTTDFDGNYAIQVAELPVTLTYSYIGYNPKEYTYTSASEVPTVAIEVNSIEIMEAEIVAEKLSEKQKQEPLTVETMDVLSIKEAPSGNFYEGLGNMKGVDLTSASLGFKVINTRGFNSTSPVRSLQLIDGVDNQSPGLNFSLGNFLGTSDLDVMKVEIVAGASSAFFGPGAFNGVVNMTTKDPYRFPGLSVSLKGGERRLGETAVRWADYFTNEEGEEKFGYKINFFGFRADDWEATDYSPVTDSRFGEDHPFGFDAVNIYGDEPVAGNNVAYANNVNLFGPFRFARNGYREEDLVDYDTDNIKFNTGLFYKFNPELMLNYSFSYSQGSTVYQGDNRYRLENIQFFQNKIELSKENKWFIRAYATNEDAGDTYDIVTTAIRMQDEVTDATSWNGRFANAWNASGFQEEIQANPRYDEIFNQVLNSGLTGDAQLQLFDELLGDWYYEDFELFNGYYNETIELVDGLSQANGDPAFFKPGTARFDSLAQSIRSRKFTEGGSLFFDRSALYHTQAERTIDSDHGTFRVGGNGRFYRPDTQGTIFRDTLSYVFETDFEGNQILVDSVQNRITNWEVGAYGGWEDKFMEDKLIVNLTLRVDKNQNFDFLVSPAASLVYAASPDHTWRTSFTSAVRNPTLADQYLFYDVGRAILLGNIDGQYEAGNDSLFTIDSFTEYRNANSQAEGLSRLEYFNVDRIRPEQVRSLEVGYRGTWWEKVFIDASYYLSRYTDFIGFTIGLDADFDQGNGTFRNLQAYRLASNAEGIVFTQGFSVGANYFFKDFNLSANYSWNKLVSGEDDPIIPAFNTPEHKFNLGLTGRNMSLFNDKIRNVGFGINYKWIQGFTFEGSPQFTGLIPTYDLVDAQINKEVPKIHCTFKLGASNLFGVMPFFRAENEGFGDKFKAALNNENIQVYGGPRVGRLAYFSVVYDLNHKKKNN